MELLYWIIIMMVLIMVFRVFAPFLVYLIPFILIYSLIRYFLSGRSTSSKQDYDNTYTDYHSNDKVNSDVIDVEYTEREDD